MHLIQLPPYCPHLNPIERLWAVMHQCVTHNRHYPTRKAVRRAPSARSSAKPCPREWNTFRTEVLEIQLPRRNPPDRRLLDGSGVLEGETVKSTTKTKMSIKHLTSPHLFVAPSSDLHR
ncbi:MAG: transposase [Roseovarius sp.]|nr:transposase [Roseovarius sp.]